MAISEAFAGSEAVGATEHSCTTDTAGPDVETSDGVFQVFLDVSDMINADELVVRVYEKVQSAGTQRVVYTATLADAQVEPVFVLPSLILMHGWDVTLQATNGTITVEWSIRKVA